MGAQRDLRRSARWTFVVPPVQPGGAQVHCQGAPMVRGAVPVVYSSRMRHKYDINATIQLDQGSAKRQDYPGSLYYCNIDQANELGWQG